MTQNSEEKSRENLSMEEYLKRRQGVNSRETVRWDSREELTVSALKLATVFYF